MKIMNKYKTLLEAKDYFSSSKYDEALRNYALVLKEYPNSKEAYNGAILAEMAMSGEAGAEELFDYYIVLREENSDQADTIISEILETMDGSLEEITELLKNPVQEKLLYEDGILYEDFKKLIVEDGDFKTTFENIMFSTRVIITAKDDFVDFLDQLITNEYREMAMSYLEGALSVYPNDPALRTQIERLTQKSD
jgi:tetratricopeptide (TPR) repeat protein